MRIFTGSILLISLIGCESDLRVRTSETACQGPSCDPSVTTVPDGGPATQSPNEDKHTKATKLSSEDCLDPDLTKVPSDVFLTLCNGESAQGSLDLSLLSPQNIKSGITIGGVEGTAPLEAHVDCSADGAFGCVNDGVNFKAMAVAGLQASNIRFGVSIAGVNGSVIEKPADCGADGVVGCVTTASYKSADVNAIIAADLKSGKTIAGISGSIANCSDGGVGCYVVGPTFVATASGTTFSLVISNPV